MIVYLDASALVKRYVAEAGSAGAAALVWQDMLGDPVVVATCDRQLWDAARAAAQPAWPDAL